LGNPDWIKRKSWGSGSLFKRQSLESIATEAEAKGALTGGEEILSALGGTKITLAEKGQIVRGKECNSVGLTGG